MEANGRRIELRAEPTGWWLPLRINGLGTAGLIDTGATCCAVTAAEADRLHLTADREPARFTDGSSRRVYSGVVEVPNAEQLAATITLRLYEWDSSHPSADGVAMILGRDLLQAFSMLVIAGDKMTVAL